MVFDFFKKKSQEAAARPARIIPGSEADYEERRKWAENLVSQGRVEAAISLMEELAADLAGAGNFPLAVAVRHQINRWKPEREAKETPAEAGQKMAEQRAKSGVFQRPLIPLDPSVEKAVKASSFLEGLNAVEISGLIDATGLQQYPAGQIVVKEGSAGDHLYIVTRGVLRVSTSGVGGGEVRVGTLHVGDFFGEVALLTGRPRAASVLAETDAECLQVAKADWDRLSKAHPRLLGLLESAMAERAQLSAEAVIDDLRRRRGADESP